jgi:hypothetical protein
MVLPGHVGAKSGIGYRKTDMGLQKYRADYSGDKQSNGGIPYYTKWVGGPTLALVRNCKIENANFSPRTVYVRGEADTWFSIPAACTHKGKTVTGYLTCDDKGEYVFRAHKEKVS